MEDQNGLRRQLDDFIKRRGIKIVFLAKETGISHNTMYNFRAGSRLLSRRQVQTLSNFMTEYDKKLGGQGGVYG